MKNGIIIPCYNEENRIAFAEYESFLQNNKQFKICFVNDGSNDKTIDSLYEFKGKFNHQVAVLDLEINKGKAEAVRQGVLYMLENSDVENIGFLDADLATGFDDYKNMKSQMSAENYKLVFGSRKMLTSCNVERSMFRKFASAIVGFLIQLIIGMKIKDTQCGAKIFDRNLATHLFRKPFHSKWLFDVELFIRLKTLYGRDGAFNCFKEISLSKWRDVEGSKITLKDSVKFPIRLIEIAFIYNIYFKLESKTGVFKSSFVSLVKGLQIN